MSKEETREIINFLYEKYGISKSFYEGFSCDEIISGMKGILANLDENKTRDYEKKDIEIIKDIFGMWC